MRTPEPIKPTRIESLAGIAALAAVLVLAAVTGLFLAMSMP